MTKVRKAARPTQLYITPAKQQHTSKWCFLCTSRTRTSVSLGNPFLCNDFPGDSEKTSWELNPCMFVLKSPLLSRCCFSYPVVQFKNDSSPERLAKIAYILMLSKCARILIWLLGSQRWDFAWGTEWYHRYLMWRCSFCHGGDPKSSKMKPWLGIETHKVVSPQL